MALSKYKFIAFISFKVSDRNKVNFVQQESQLSTQMRRFTKNTYLNNPKQFMAFYGKINTKTDRNNKMSSSKQIIHKVNFAQQESKALYIKKIGNLFQNNYTLIEEINRVKNDIDNYKSVSTVIGLNIRENDSRLNFNLNRVNEKEFSHNLHLEHKRLVNKAKEYEKNTEISKVVSNYDK
ncbi:22646_t:CDS:2 [Dentiscutata erythropus]|uniref:22646_t:CDS:1 n=1 Tax=Dentiscutata erythropus TaxID=1348616 RepID=A0A9N9DIA8_9GLOM|nr:22646_t:CDS:2 [Dentiscutata erythropus]